MTAAAMSRSQRSLQRDLASAGSPFPRELDGACVRVAMRLLVERDAPLTEIAHGVGCASPQRFSTLFRRVIGTPPSVWRDRQRSRRSRSGCGPRRRADGPLARATQT